MSSAQYPEFLQEIIEAQNGLVVQSLAAAGGISIDQAAKMLAAQLPDIAQRLTFKSRNEGDYEHLLTALSDPICDAPLDDVRILFNRSIIRDSEDALAHLYGSVESAHGVADRICPVPEKEIVNRQMMTFSMTLILAVMAKRLRSWRLGKPLSNSIQHPQRGTLVGLGQALIDGMWLGFKRSFMRRRKRFSYGRPRDLKRENTKSLGAKPDISILLGGFTSKNTL